jgi:hypothetical protein
VDVAALVFSGLLSLYGVLIWRVVWTREVSKALWNAERGWRLRLVLALDQGAPTVRHGPALIVFVWSLFLFLLAKKLDADGAVTVLGIALLVMLVHYGASCTCSAGRSF